MDLGSDISEPTSGNDAPGSAAKFSTDSARLDQNVRLGSWDYARPDQIVRYPGSQLVNNPFGNYS